MVTMPALSPTMEVGSLVSWSVGPGYVGEGKPTYVYLLFMHSGYYHIWAHHLNML